MQPKAPVPHFLRVTQTLALVSGLVAAPSAGLVACGGDTDNNSDAGNPGPCAQGACGTVAYDGGALGRVNDGSPVGLVANDGGPVGVVVDGGIQPYDGGPVGDVALDGGPDQDSGDSGHD